MEEIIAGDFGALKRSSQRRSDDDVQASIIAPPNIDTAFPAPPFFTSSATKHHYHLSSWILDNYVPLSLLIQLFIHNPSA